METLQYMVESSFICERHISKPVCLSYAISQSHEKLALARLSIVMFLLLVFIQPESCMLVCKGEDHRHLSQIWVFFL